MGEGRLCHLCGRLKESPREATAAVPVGENEGWTPRGAGEGEEGEPVKGARRQMWGQRSREKPLSWRCGS